MAQIVVELEPAVTGRIVESGGPGDAKARVLADGDRWTVEDLICTWGSRDRPSEQFRDQRSDCHRRASHFLVSRATRADDRPRADDARFAMLGNPGQYFECGHQRDAGDRCISFGYGRSTSNECLATREPAAPAASLC